MAVACAATTAYADTLRCGNVLIETGAVQAYVLEKCGEPTSRSEISEPILARRENGTTYQVGTTSEQVWFYKRGQGQFPAVLTFDGGVLKKLEFQK